MMVVALRWDDAADCFSARQAHIMLQDKERQTMLNNTYPPRHATQRDLGLLYPKEKCSHGKRVA